MFFRLGQTICICENIYLSIVQRQNLVLENNFQYFCPWEKNRGFRDFAKRNDCIFPVFFGNYTVPSVLRPKRQAQGLPALLHQAQKVLPLHGLMLQKVGGHGVQLGAVGAQQRLAASVGAVDNVLDLLVDALGHGLGIAAAVAHGAADKDLLLAVVEAEGAQLFAHAVDRHHFPGDLRGALDVVAGAGGNIPQAQLFRHPAAQKGHDPVLHIALGEVGAVLLGKGNGHAACPAPGDNGDLADGILPGQKMHHHGVARLVKGGEPALMLGDDAAALFRAGDDLDLRGLEVLHGDKAAAQISAVANLTALQKIDNTDKSEYGLDAPEITITVTLSDGTERNLYIGDSALFEAADYLLDVENDSIYLIDETLYSAFNCTLEEMEVQEEVEATEETEVTDEAQKTEEITE